MMKHVDKFKLNENNDPYNEENWNENDEPEDMVVKVKDIIKYLQNNFDLEANVYLDHDGWWIYGDKPNNIQELILRRGIFQDFRGDLFIQN